VRPRSILVVDDKEDIREVLALLLGSRGHTVEIAPDGPAALKVVADFCPEFALVDLHLPRMDGYELARRLRALFDSLVLVAMTASAEAADGTKARDGMSTSTFSSRSIWIASGRSWRSVDQRPILPARDATVAKSSEARGGFGT